MVYPKERVFWQYMLRVIYSKVLESGSWDYRFLDLRAIGFLGSRVIVFSVLITS